MFISHGIWLLRTRDLRRRAKDAGMSFDDYPEVVEWQDKGVDFTFETLWKKLRYKYDKRTT